MEIRPIFSALLRNKVGLVLIGLQVALTLAIVVNALFIIQERIARIDRSSGIDEANIFRIASIGFTPDWNNAAAIDEDLRLLRQLPGVRNAFVTNTTPLSQNGWSTTMRTKAEDDVDGLNTAVYFADEHAIDSYGVDLVAGRNFTPEEIGQFRSNDELLAGVVIVTEAAARGFYPDEPELAKIVGKPLYISPTSTVPPATIIGIVRELKSPWDGGWSPGVFERSALVPFKLVSGNNALYVIRTEPGERERVMKEIESAMSAANSNRILRSIASFEDIRRNFYSGDRGLAIVLAVVVGALLLITGLGIIGLVSFWVTQRTKQIGTRRALGATRPNVLRYFLTENAIICVFGVVLGAVMAYGLNVYLVNEFEMARLPWYWVPVGAAIVFAMGQLATIGPATRATRVSPSVATRSV
jgi:putative ABC transport system permease protein